MAKAWDRKTRHGFEFSVKVWQKFTHEKKIGKDAGYPEENWESPTQEDVDLFRKGIDPLVGSGKLGVLLMQYPASFHCTARNIEKLGWTLRAFRDYPKIVELRHRSWSDSSKLTKGLFAEGGASWALIDEPKFAFSIRQEFEPVGDIFYLRLHGRNYEKWWEHSEAWERYDYLYSQEQFEALAADLKSIAGQHADRLRKVFVFFNNHARGQAAVNAIMLSHHMGIPIKGVPVEEFVKAFPQISGIFQKPAQGHLFDPSNFRRNVFWKVLSLAQLPKVTIHSIRHSFGSMLLEQGETLDFVKDQLGHHSIQITVDTYGHRLTDNRTAVDALEKKVVAEK